MRIKDNTNIDDDVDGINLEGSNHHVDTTNVKMKDNKIESIRKVCLNQIAISNIQVNGIKKMEEMNLPLVRWRTKCRLERERRALKEELYTALKNDNSTGAIATFVDRLNDDDDHVTTDRFRSNMKDLL